MHAILVHGWKGWPENAWFPWLRKELEAKGFTTEALELPNPLLPERKEWVDMIRNAIKSPDTVFVGHSLGCPAIMLALQKYDGPPVEHVVCVSGFGRAFVKTELFKKWSDWFRADIDISLIKKKAKKWSVIHSKYDYVVPVKEGEWLAKQLGVKIVLTKTKGHLIHEERCFELPEVLHEII